MATDEHQADDVATLLAAAGCPASEHDIEGVRALYRRFAADRATLAALDLDETEPLSIVATAALTGGAA